MNLNEGCTGLQPLVPDQHKASLGKVSGGFKASEAKRFLELLGKDNAATWLRAIDPVKTRKRSGGADYQGVASKADKAWIDAKTAAGFNVYAITGNAAAIKGTSVKDTDITRCPALFVEWDDGADIDTQAQRWQALELPEPTLMVSTGGKSVHCYWVLLEPMAPEPWRVLQSRLITYCKGDTACKNPSRLPAAAAPALSPPRSNELHQSDPRPHPTVGLLQGCSQAANNRFAEKGNSPSRVQAPSHHPPSH